jgi:hypothetical protein
MAVSKGNKLVVAKIVGAIIFGLLQESESFLAYLKATHLFDCF